LINNIGKEWAPMASGGGFANVSTFSGFLELR